MNVSQKSRISDRELFTAVELGPYLLPNRIVMAPMTRNRADPSGVPKPITATYYAQRATAGLIISEAVQVSQQGQAYPATPGLYTDAHVRGWRRVTEAVHGRGGRIFAQLFHAGRISHPSLQPHGLRPVAPSSITPAGLVTTRDGRVPFVEPSELSIEAIEAVIADYRLAADYAVLAGFDGVEIHAGNGYLVDQFLRNGTNQRSDRYGGSPRHRARFLLEVSEAAADVLGADRVGVRISPVGSFNDMSDSAPQSTFGVVVRELDRLGLAYLHVVESESAVPFDFSELRTLFSGPYIANGGYGYESASAAVMNGRADLVSFGKLFIANPDLPERFATSSVLNVEDRNRFYEGDEQGYIDYPSLAEAVRARGARQRVAIGSDDPARRL